LRCPEGGEELVTAARARAAVVGLVAAERSQEGVDARRVR